MSWGAGNTDVRWEFFWPDVPDGYNYDDFYVSPMKMWNGPFSESFQHPSGQWDTREVFYHDQGSKTVLDVDLPANDPSAPEDDYAYRDVGRALDTLFNHQNTGPFISKLLIQRLVTSNPSPEFIGRVASAFADNGSGVRGDMQAVVKAILLDPEARSYSVSEDPHYGMQKEPYLRFVSIARAFDAASESGIYEVYWLNDQYGMTPLSSPSVFNFFSPNYQPSGPIKDAGLVAPEFQITNEVTGILVPNHFFGSIWYQISWNGTHPNREVFFDFSEEIALIDDTDALLEHLDITLLHGQMSNELRELLYFTLTRPDVTNQSDTERTKLAIYLTVSSPEFAIMY